MTFNISTHHWDHDERNAEEFKKITREILGRSFKAKEITKVYLNDVRGKYYPPSNDDFFVISFFASASEYMGVQELPKEFWGFSKKTRGNDGGLIFEPSGKGMLIIDPINNYALAELINNNLYLLYPANDSNLFQEKSLFGIYRKVLQEALKFMGGFPTLEAMVSGEFTLPDAKTLGDMKKDVGYHRQEVTRRITHGIALEDKLRKGQVNKTESDQQIDRLYDIPEIKSISVDEKKLILFTHTMYSEDPDQNKKNIHAFGEFRVELKFGRYAKATFKNLTRRPYEDERGSYGHPHVDRGSRGNEGYWCEGEGIGILHQLEIFEFEAAVLFALKAISSVNDSEGGNYLRVLRSFPIVEKRDEYPKVKTPLTRETRKAFIDIFEQNRVNHKNMLEEDITKIQQAVKLDQMQIIQGALAETFEKLIAETPKGTTRKTVLSPVTKITLLLKDELLKVKLSQYVHSYLIEGDVLKVKTTQLHAIETTTKTKYPIGQIIIEYDFENGKISFKNERPIRLHDGRYFQAPQVPGEYGDLPLGELASTIPELLGNLEIETAVNLSLDFLMNFNATEVDTEILKQMSIRQKQQKDLFTA